MLCLQHEQHENGIDRSQTNMLPNEATMSSYTPERALQDAFNSFQGIVTVDVL